LDFAKYGNEALINNIAIPTAEERLFPFIPVATSRRYFFDKS
jgi:hypothetical protein